jgi:DNA-binding transcriptional regulator GbsR (MarR family)
MNGKPTPLYQLAERIGNFIEYWGFKEIHGKVWTCIFVAEKPVDAGQIVETLQVSKALVSLAIKDLLHYRVIEAIPKLGPSTQKYRSNRELFQVILGVLKTREREMLTQISGAFAKLDSQPDHEKNKAGISQTHLNELSEMISTTERALDSVIALNDLSLKEINAVLTLTE